MTEIYLGLMGMTSAIIIFTAGIYLGRKFDSLFNNNQNQNNPDSREFHPAPPLSESERRRIRDEQEAFQILQNYSVSDAYGLNADFHLTYHPENNPYNYSDKNPENNLDKNPENYPENNNNNNNPQEKDVNEIA